MGDLSKFIQIEANQFEDYFESSQPFDHEFPTTFPKISNFQRLVLVRVRARSRTRAVPSHQQL